MKRRKFLGKAGLLLLNGPILLQACKKPESITPASTITETKTPEPTNTTPAVTTPVDTSKFPTLASSIIVDGYPDRLSYFPGDTVNLYLSTNNTYTNFKLDVGDAKRNYVFAIPVLKAYTQTIQANAPYTNGYGYVDPVSFVIPKDIKSGVYLIGNQIPFIVKSSLANVDFTIVYPNNTETAYNPAGGKTLYDSNPIGTIRARQVSFLKPTPYTFFAAGIFNWLLTESFTYNVISDMDLDDATNLKGKMLVLTGHNEYWTRKGRQNFDAFVNSGKHALVLSGNTMYWQVRYNDTKDQLICYKSVADDPTTNALEKTYLWSTPSIGYLPADSIGINGLLGGYGTQSTKSWKGLKIQSPDLPIFKGVTLKKGDIIECDSHEYDSATITGFDTDGFPIIDNKILNYNKLKLIGFDTCADYNDTTLFHTATAFMFRKTASSGVVINMASTNWCTNKYFVQDTSGSVVKITRNCLTMLLANQDVFGS